MRSTKQVKITLYRRDVQAFELRAHKGEIAQNLVQPLARLLSAMRELQTAAKGGHFPLDVIFDELPSAYGTNWLKERSATV